MKNKIIGISPRINFSSKKSFVRVCNDYVNALEKRDFTTIILTPSKNFESQLKLCDGFLCIGGDDFDPTMYNETNIVGLSKEINEVVDKTDKQMIEYAIKHKLPLMGICRGHQALCACLGTKLIQDMKFEGFRHDLVEPHLHFIERIKDFGIAKLLPQKFMINSFHHQAVKVLPDGFIPLYVNNDIIEMMEHSTLPIFSVQWHPERYDSKESEIIFDYFDHYFK